MIKPQNPHLQPLDLGPQAATLVKILKFAGNRINCFRTRKMNRRGVGQAFAVLVVARPHPSVAHEYEKKLRIQNISGLVSDVTGLKWLDEGAVSASGPYTIKSLLEQTLGVKIKVEPYDS